MFLSTLRIVMPYPSLLLGKPGDRTLVISDLHMGWEVQLSEQGIHIPSQMTRMLNRLLRIVELTRPKSLVILGDVKHTVSRVELEEWRDIPRFFEALTGKLSNIMVVPGNHDGNLEALTPVNVEICSSSGIVVDGVGLLHGHAWPSPSLLECESLVMGHVHPTLFLKDSLGYGFAKQVWVRAGFDVEGMMRSYLKYAGIEWKGGDATSVFRERFGVNPKTRRIVVMPSFNDLMGGKPLNRAGLTRGEYLGPLMKFMDLDEADVHLLDGSYMGRLKPLRLA